jgi:hypothetical protein
VTHDLHTVARTCLSSRANRLFVLAALASTLQTLDARAHTRSRLDSFYVTFSNYRVVHVEPIDGGVKIRVIDIDFHDDICWQRVVRAHEVVLHDATVEALAATPVCALSERRVDRAVERSREHFIKTRYDIPTGVDINTVVAVCGGREQRFVFDSHEKTGINGARLKKVDAAVQALWALGDRVAARASASVPGVTAQETLGTAAAADLVAGKYDAAFRDM